MQVVEMSGVSCRYQPACPGCPRFGEHGLAARGWGRLLALAQAFDFDTKEVEEHDDEGWGHRHRARLSVRGATGDVRIGIFEAGSHRLVHIPECPIHHRAIRRFLPQLVEWLNRHRVEPYQELQHRGLLRAVQLAVEPDTERLQVVLLVRDELRQPEGLVARFAPLWQAFAPAFCGLFVGALPEASNSLVATRIVKVAGEEMVVDELGESRVFFPPDAFGQANPRLHARAVRRIQSFVAPGSEVVEYYAGVGTIGLGLAPRVRRLSLNELGAGSLRGLGVGIEEAGMPHVAVLEGRAGDRASAYQESDTVIVDPPRKGLDAALFTRLLERPPARLIYLSCGLSAFEREATQFAKAEAYRLRHLSGWTYFPFTEHVETLAVFDRRASRPGPEDGPIVSG